MSIRGTVLTVLTLVIFASVSAVVTVAMTAHAIDATADVQAREAPEIARLYIAKDHSLAAAAPEIIKHVTRDGLRVNIIDPKDRVVYTALGVVHRRFPGPAPRTPRGGGRYGHLIASLAGISPRRVPIDGGELLIVPDTARLMNVFRNVGSALAVSFAIGIAVLWWYGRGVRREAMRPLLETTASLKRLAQRDFSPRTIVTGDKTPFGELARAYNEAVAEVSTTFAERRAAEIEMQRFIADAGHELRTPLTIVMGYLDIIESGALADPDVAGRVISGMRSQTARMRKLIEKLIILARMETPADLDQRTDLDVVSLVNRVVESLEQLAMTPPLIVEATFAHVFANEDELAEALTNIIENGLKYAPSDVLTIVVKRAADRVRITISDRGPGMSPDEQRNAFERFFRGDGRGEIVGSGLGLAIAKRAVERAHGTISLDSVLGIGTTVTIDLPQTPINVERTSQLIARC